MMKLKERCNKFIKEIGIPITVFCKNIGVSRTQYYAWQKGERNLPRNMEQRILDYLEKYNF